jgi:DNA polymerase III delta prime subunit
LGDAIEDVRATLNDLFGDLKTFSSEAEEAARDAVDKAFSALSEKLRDAKVSLKSSLEVIEEQLSEEPDLAELIDEDAVIELAEALRDGDRVHAQRMLERVFEADARLLAAIQQAAFERPRMAA